MVDDLGSLFVSEARGQFDRIVTVVHHAVGQLDEPQMWHRAAPRLNSVANLLLHLAGNFTQRFATNIAGRPDTRERDAEFTTDGSMPKADVMARFDAAVSLAREVMSGMTTADLTRTARLQMMGKTVERPVMGLLMDVIGHFNGHAQEILYMTRVLRGDGFRFQNPDGVPKAMR